MKQLNMDTNTFKFRIEELQRDYSSCIEEYRCFESAISKRCQRFSSYFGTTSMENAAKDTVDRLFRELLITQNVPNPKIPDIDFLNPKDYSDHLLGALETIIQEGERVFSEIAFKRLRHYATNEPQLRKGRLEFVFCSYYDKFFDAIGYSQLEEMRKFFDALNYFLGKLDREPIDTSSMIAEIGKKQVPGAFKRRSFEIGDQISITVFKEKWKLLIDLELLETLQVNWLEHGLAA